MFDALLSKLVASGSIENRRAEGVAFFRVAKDLYGIKSVEYLAANISLASRQEHYAHCTYSDIGVRHCISVRPVCVDLINELGLTAPEPIDWTLTTGQTIGV